MCYYRAVAIPIVSDVSPSVGHPGGGHLLVITGSAFAVPVVTAPTSLPAAAPTETMTVTVGGRAATDVQVWSETLITCICPSYRGDPSLLSADPGVEVDVVVSNIGPPVESATVDDGFAYQRTDMTDDETNLVHVLRWLVLELRRQVIQNVVLSTHPDYDGSTADGLDIVELAAVPGIALFGPRLLADPARQRRGYQDTQDLTALEFEGHKPQSFRRLVFDATLVGETPIEVLRLEEEFEAFFQRNGALTIPSDPTDASSEVISLPLFLTTPPDRSGAAGSAGTVSSAAAFELHGVSLDAVGQIRVRSGEIFDDMDDLEIRRIDKE